jgi:hypothetical protein
MARSIIKAELSLTERGLFLEHRDGPVIRKFFEDAKQLVAKNGEEQVRLRVGRRAKHPTGSFAGAVHTKDFKKGRTIQADYPQILYGPWLEGTSTRNTSTRFRGYSMFRLTRTWLRRNYMALIQDLLRGAVAELNGGG